MGYFTVTWYRSEIKLMGGKYDPNWRFIKLKEHYRQLKKKGMDEKRIKELAVKFEGQDQRRKLKFYRVELNRLVVYWEDEMEVKELEQLYFDSCAEKGITPKPLLNRKYYNPIYIKTFSIEND